MATVKALLVGIDDYGDPRNNLNSCLADVHYVRSRLERDYGFPAGNITTLVDGSATVPNVRAALDTLFGGVRGDDRLVFMYSGHGYQVPEGDSLTEVLVLRDGFFSDDELTQRASSLPPAVLTVIFDSCFSGGMQKFFVTKAGGEATRSKVWLPNDEQAKALNAALTGGAVSKLGLFGAHPISSSQVAAAQKGLSTTPIDDHATKALDEQGQPRINALLLSACRENETASAKRSDTEGLSAFTFALGKAIDALGANSTPPELHRESERILTTMGFNQRPLIFEPSTAPGMALSTFILGRAPHHEPIPGSVDFAAVIAAAIEQAMSQLRKEKTMTVTTAPPSTNGQVETADQKWLDFLTSTLPIVLPPVMNGISSLFKEYQATTAAPPQKSALPEQADQKWLSFLASTLPMVLPPVMNGISSLFKEYQATGAVPPAEKSAIVEEADQKWLGFLASTLPIVLPPVIDGISSLFKEYQATTTSAPAAAASAPVPA